VKKRGDRENTTNSKPEGKDRDDLEWENEYLE